MTWSLVLGLGMTGTAVARHLSRIGEDFKVHDDDKVNEVGTPFAGDWRGCGQVVASPGVKDSHPLLREARKRRLPVVCDLALAAPHAPPLLVAVTGTAGKTTLAFLIARMLEEAGMEAHVVGNSGRSPLDLLGLEPAPHAWVVEVSSFQARRLGAFKPTVAVHLNLHPNHLDWHPSMRDYRLAKEAVFANQDENCHRVLGPGVPGETLPGAARSWRIGGLHGWSWMSGFVVPSGLAPGKTIEASHPQLFPDTIAAATGVAFLCGVKPEAIRRALRAFAPLPHRYEVLGNFGGKRWINDSKSTSPFATLAALARSPSPVALLVGGSDKGLQYREVLQRAARRGTRVLPFGEIGPAIAKEAVDIAGLACDPPATLEEAVQSAAACSSGTTVLLSPGSASFDQFTGYAERGDHFRALVHTLGERQ
ncbi:hypothetical protein IIA16_05335 [bacterium]|nr:hypothetical protein [bacterium]